MRHYRWSLHIYDFRDLIKFYREIRRIILDQFVFRLKLCFTEFEQQIIFLSVETEGDTVTSSFLSKVSHTFRLVQKFLKREKITYHFILSFNTIFRLVESCSATLMALRLKLTRWSVTCGNKYFVVVILCKKRGN